jgi:hypothetical protein
MTRKSLLLTTAIILVLLGAGVAGLMALVRHEPAFYVGAAIAPGTERKAWSDDFRRKFNQELIQGIISEIPWAQSFTQDQVNAYLAEDFLKMGTANMPDDFSDPRMVLEADRIRIGFRYGEGAWSTIISADLKVWLAVNECNVVVIEVEGLYAGGLPITSQSLLERFAESARRQEMEVTWYRLNGHPVALLRFQPGKKDPTVQLKHFKLQDGMLHVAGGPTDSRSRTLPVSAPPAEQ